MGPCAARRPPQTTLATSNALVNPLVAVVVVAGLGGEPLSPMVFAAMFIILLGVGLVARWPRADSGEFFCRFIIVVTSIGLLLRR